MKPLVPFRKTDLLDAPLHLSPKPIIPTRMGSRARQHIHQQRAMFRAVARSMLAEHGYMGVHIRDLAGRCGVSTQTLYNNLGSRDEILSSAVDELLQIQIARARIDSERTGWNFILVFCDLTARVMKPDWDYVRAIVAVLKEQGNRPMLADTVEKRSIAAYREHLSALRESAELKSWVDVNKMAIKLMDISRFILEQCWRDNSTAEQLRYELSMGLGLPLLGMTRGQENRRIEAYIESICSPQAGRLA